MKKISITVLVLLFVMQIMMPIYAKDYINISVIKDNVIESDKNFKLGFDTDVEYYAFIFNSSNLWEVEKIIGPSECEDGFLYVKEIDKNIIRKLVDVKINSFYEDNEKIYFPYNNGIYSIDYNGNNLELIIEIDNGVLNNNIIKIYNNKIYYCLDNCLMSYDISREKTDTLYNVNGMTDLYIKSENEFIYLIDKEAHYVTTNVRNVSVNTQSKNYNYHDIIVSNIENLDALILEKDNYEDNQLSISASPYVNQKDYNLKQIMAAYPVNSYFTADGGPCYHHGTGCSYSGGCNCKYYASSIQCMAFAKKISDMYAHKSSWNPPSSEIYDRTIIGNCIRFNSANQVKLFFDSLSTGTYIRLSHSTNESDNGFHSLFLISKNNNSVKTYECNVDGHCKIEIYNLSYEAYITRFNVCYGIYSVSHNYSSNATVYSSIFHKYNCTTCGGYILEYHYGPTLGNGACLACDAVTDIQYNFPMNRGEY